MIPLIPYKHVVINTSLTVDEVVSVLSREVWPRRSWLQRLYINWSGFEGKISSRGFTINRIICYRNAWLPIMHGRFHPHDNGVRVDVYMTMSPFVIGFSVLWFGGVTLAFLAFIVDSIVSYQFNPGVFLLLGMLFFGYLLEILSFGLEVPKATRFINKVFEDHKTV